MKGWSASLAAAAVLAGACAALPSGPGGRGGFPSFTPSPPPGPPWLDDVRLPEHLPRPARDVEIEIASACRTLLEGDFQATTGAARRLVDLGEIAVPYLGHVAAAVSDPDGRVPIVIATILRNAPPSHLGPLLASPYEPVLLAAAEVCGEQRVAQHAPRLVVLLDHPSEDVRRAAVAALRRISHEFHGYRPGASAGERAEATARWRALWPSG